MHTYNLNTFLAGHVFAFLMLLTRVGTVMMLFPGIGESHVPRRTRMIFASLLCLLLLPAMYARFPPMPAQTPELLRLLAYEAIIGIFFGTMLRMLMGVLEACGMVIGIESGLSSATVMNPALATQSPLSSAFLSIAGLVLIFITGLDHYLLRTTVALYDAFPPGQSPLLGDMAQTVIHIANQSFAVGIELAAPLLIMGLLLYVAMGILQRLLPSVQLFLIVLPVEIWGGLMIFSLTVASILTLWLHYFNQSVGSFFQG